MDCRTPSSYPYPWLAHYDAFVPHHLEYAEQSIPQLFQRATMTHGDEVALEFMGTAVTYRELEIGATRIANHLMQLGVKPGDRVLLLYPNTPHFVLSYYGALKCGAVVVPASPLDTATEVEYKLKHSQSKIVFFLDLLYGSVKGLVQNSGVVQFIAGDLADYLPFPQRHLFRIKKKTMARELPDCRTSSKLARFTDVASGGSKDDVSVETRPDELAVILYTGGTTGLSKGVMLSHRALAVNQEMAKAWADLSSADVQLCVLPFFHGFGLSVGLHLGLIHGLKLVLVPRFDPKSVLSNIEKRGVTIFAGVPTMYIAMLRHPSFRKLRRARLRGCFVGAAPAPESLKEQFQEKTGGMLIEGYGLTEAVTAKSANPYKGTKKPRSIGLPWPDVVFKIVDPDTGEELGPGREGELILKSPDIMMGYWKNEEATRDAIRDGWLYTGDIARMDDDGYFYIVDRKKDLIICGGYNVYPTEVEEVLFQLPQVEQACVIGVPDDYKGEVPKAYLVLKPGQRLT
ncbi:MAG: AMP-binding protein, partial [Gemmatimonadota bacterium]|nr:AMP-binding protein [Gemmatimonadota bacterium]